MSDAVKLAGLAAVRARFANLAALDVKPMLRDEAEGIAEQARAGVRVIAPGGTGELVRSIEITELNQSEALGFAVGTRDPAGGYLEYGTRKRPATPWLGPALHARLPRIKQRLRNMVSAAVKRRSIGLRTGPRPGV